MVLYSVTGFRRLTALAGCVGVLLAAGWVRPIPGPASPSGALQAAVAAPDTVPSFATDVLPIFQSRCSECHGGEDEDGRVITEAYLDLQSYEGVMAGSEYGTVIEPGDADASTLIDMITTGEMPEEGDPVPPEEIELIRAWIVAGALDN